MRRYIGHFLLATALVHSVVGVVLYWDVIVGFGRNYPTMFVPDFGDRAAAFWFLMSGFFIANMGFLAHSQRQIVSKSFGLSLVLVGLFGVALMPLSGLWVLLPIGALAAYSPLESRRIN